MGACGVTCWREKSEMYAFGCGINIILGSEVKKGL